MEWQKVKIPLYGQLRDSIEQFLQKHFSMRMQIHIALRYLRDAKFYFYGNDQKKIRENILKVLISQIEKALLEDCKQVITIKHRKLPFPELMAYDAICGYFAKSLSIVNYTVTSVILSSSMQECWHLDDDGNIIITDDIFSLYVPQEWKDTYYTESTEQLAKIIYETKNWELCPILADALMDAGCEEDHYVIWLLKNQFQHFDRGVWILNKLMRII
jgi:hypothetical protein